MSFGGSVSAMISSLKYNNSQLRRKRVFTALKKRIEEESNKKIYSENRMYSYTELDKEEIKEIVLGIRKEMRAKNKRFLILQLSIVFFLIGCVLLFLFKS